MAQRLVQGGTARSRRPASRWPRPRPPSGPGASAACCARVSLVFTAGPQLEPSARATPWSGPTCATAGDASLARSLAALVPGEAEVTGLLALLLLTDARRGARVSPSGDLVLLADQDRSRWASRPRSPRARRCWPRPCAPACPGRTR